MAESIVTPEFRSTFVALMRPKASKSDDGTLKEPTYSVRAAFPPTTDLRELKRIAGAAVKEKWGDKPPKTLRSPFRTHDELENPSPGIGLDWIIITFSSKEEYFNPRHNLVDAKNMPILDETEVYSGAWFRAQVNAKAYENAGNRGVTFYLSNVQKLRDDEPIGGGRVPASRAFEPVADPAIQGTAVGLFD